MKKQRNLAISATFLAPAFILFSVFVFAPIFMTFSYSLTDWDGVADKVLMGFQNYGTMFTDPRYLKSLTNTLTLVVLSILIEVPAGLVLAFLLSRVRFGYKFFRSVYFGPVVISSAIVAVMFSVLFNDDVGAINYILRAIGLGAIAPRWLSDKTMALYSVCIPQIWQSIGITFILFLAGMQSIPDEILESARIDGASSTQVFFRIVIPLIAEVIQMVIILAVTGALKSFDFSWIMTWGGPDVASSFLAVYMYRLTFREFSFGYGSTLAFSILVYSFLFSVVFKRIASRNSQA